MSHVGKLDNAGDRETHTDSCAFNINKKAISFDPFCSNIYSLTTEKLKKSTRTNLSRPTGQHKKAPCFKV